jgi:hypothetical protein
MWTPTTRRQHSRIVTRYQTDLTDAESARDRAAIAEAQRDRQAAPAADARDLELHLTGIKSAAAWCGQCLSWVKSAVLTMGRPLPVYLGKRTSSGRPGRSGSCQERK